jgi:hypothetical protein
MTTGNRIVALGLTLAVLALGCGDEATPPDGSPPVAVADSVYTDLEAPIVLQPADNDVADNACLAPQTIDLDPATPGQQVRYTTVGGTFTLTITGEVLFVPAAGFTGDAIGSYVVADAVGRLSNPANLIVTVRTPPPSAANLGTLLVHPAPTVLPRLDTATPREPSPN